VDLIDEKDGIRPVEKLLFLGLVDDFPDIPDP